MGTVNLPKTNQTGTNEWADVEDNDNAIIAQVNGGLDSTNLAANAVTTAKITDANVTDVKLASPNNVVYRILFTTHGILGLLIPAETYMLGSSGASVGTGGNSNVAQVSGSPISVAGSVGNRAPDIIHFDNDDYTVASKTQKLRVRAQVAANATAPAITFTVGLYPVTVAGGADALTFTLGTVVTDSTVAITTPPASTMTSAVNTDFTIPSDGAFALGVVTSGTIANDAAVQVSAQLQTRNV